DLSYRQMNTFEDFIRSLSALARALSGEGKANQAEDVYVSLMPLYQKWWTYQKGQPLIVLGRQMVEDMLALANTYADSGDRSKEAPIVAYLVKISHSPCVSPQLKQKVEELRAGLV